MYATGRLTTVLARPFLDALPAAQRGGKWTEAKHQLGQHWDSFKRFVRGENANSDTEQSTQEKPD